MPPARVAKTPATAPYYFARLIARMGKRPCCPPQTQSLGRPGTSRWPAARRQLTPFQGVQVVRFDSPTSPATAGATKNNPQSLQPGTRVTSPTAKPADKLVERFTKFAVDWRSTNTANNDMLSCDSRKSRPPQSFAVVPFSVQKERKGGPALYRFSQPPRILAKNHALC